MAAPAVAAPVAVALYMACSVGLTVGNKMAVGSLQAGTVLVWVQLAFTCAAAGALHVCRVTSVRGTTSAALRWAPVGLFFGLLLFTGMQAVKYASLSTLTVVRNVGPLFLLCGEWAAFGNRPNIGMVLSLATVLLGVCLYAWEELRGPADSRGVPWVIIDVGVVCADRLLERYLLALRPLDLSTGALVCIQNAAGTVPVAMLLLGPCVGEWTDLRIEPRGLLWGLATLPVSVAIAYASVLLARAVSATAALVVANVDKVLVLGYGVLFMGDSMGKNKALGCVLALAGGAWHAWARSATAPSGGGARQSEALRAQPDCEMYSEF